MKAAFASLVYNHSIKQIAPLLIKISPVNFISMGEKQTINVLLFQSFSLIASNAGMKGGRFSLFIPSYKLFT